MQAAFLSVPGCKRQVLFGGRSSDAKYYNDVWSWDLEDRSWSRLSRDGLKQAPQPRDHTSMAYHAGSLIVWGEGAPSFSAYSPADVLRPLDCTCPATIPVSCRQPSLGLCKLSAVPCAGGRGGPDYASSIPLGDLWTFDLLAGSWQRQIANSRVPLPRWLFTYDVYTDSSRAGAAGNATQGGVSDLPASQQVVSKLSSTQLVIFGGETYEGCYLNDLWQLDLDTYDWELLSEAQLDSKRCRSLVSA